MLDTQTYITDTGQLQPDRYYRAHRWFIHKLDPTVMVATPVIVRYVLIDPESTSARWHGTSIERGTPALVNYDPLDRGGPDHPNQHGLVDRSFALIDPYLGGNIFALEEMDDQPEEVSS